jgi:deoxyribonuclease V
VTGGRADLDPDGLPGLGARGREQSGVPVTGGARTPFRTATHAIPVRRGPSARPLYVTAGIPRADAAGLVRQMAGRHRLPDAPRRAGPAPWPATACLSRRAVPDGCTVNGAGRCYV